MQVDNQNQLGANGLSRWFSQMANPGGNDKSKKMTSEQGDVQRALVMHELWQQKARGY